MQAVIETRAYLAAADDAGMSEAERANVVTLIASDPTIGDIMPGCGGARKVRVRKPGGGKSGGYRLISYFGGDDMPVFLLTLYGKNEKTNLTTGERNQLGNFAKTLRASLSGTSRGRG